MGMGGLGSGIGYADTAVGTPTAVVGAFQIKPPDTSAKDIDVKPDLAGAGHHAHLPGGDDSDKATFAVPYSAANMVLFGTTLRRLTKFWTITMPDGGHKKFWGYIPVAKKNDIDADTLMQIDVEIQPTCDPTTGAGPAFATGS